MAEPSPVSKAGALLLIVLGGLWVLLTGGCTVYFLANSIQSLARYHGAFNPTAFILFLAIGAACTAPGAGMLVVAMLILRRKS